MSKCVRGALRRGAEFLLLSLLLATASVPARAVAEVASIVSPPSAEQRAARVQEAFGRQGAVAAGHPEAAAIGIEILKAGGNAVDAAVAVALALGVAEPYGSGMGGKCIVVFRRGSDGAVFAVEGLGAAGSDTDPDAYRSLPSELRNIGGRSVAVPALPAVVDRMHREWGSLPWEQLVQPSIDLAREGFLVVEKTPEFFEPQLQKLRENAELGRLYLPDGELPKVGTRLANPELATLMEAFRDRRRAGFYEGEFGGKLVEGIRAAGGVVTAEDFAGYEAVLGKPVAATLGGHRILSGPPPTTGGTFLLLTYASLMGQLDTSQPLRSPENLDRMGRVIQQAYPAIQAHLGDSPRAPDAIAAMIRRDFVELLRARADAAEPSRPYAKGDLAGEVSRRMADPAAPSALPATPREAGEEEESTTHFVVADAAGNVVSVTQSLSHHFGSGLVVPGTGLVLNNDISNFSFTPGGVNVIAPGRRARSTTTPTIIMKDGKPFLAIGIPGGGRIPTAVLQAVLDVLQFGADPADAVAASRVHLVRSLTRDGTHNRWQVEHDFPEEIRRELVAKGWRVDVQDDPEAFGGFNAIAFEEDGTMRAIADLRRTNAAVAY